MENEKRGVSAVAAVRCPTAMSGSTPAIFHHFLFFHLFFVIFFFLEIAHPDVLSHQVPEGVSSISFHHGFWGLNKEQNKIMKNAWFSSMCSLLFVLVRFAFYTFSERFLLVVFFCGVSSRIFSLITC